MLPLISNITIGQDYPLYAIQSQIELFFSLEMGSFPLFIPGYYIGQTSSALPLGQIFHPISHIAAHIPGYWDGHALQINTLLRLLELGLCQLVLYRFLREVRLGALIAFLLSMVTVYNLKMLDLFRFGASLETWAAHLMLCAAIGLYWLKPSRRRSALLIASTYLIVCSGHPQMMYFGLIGAGIFALATPFFVAEMLQEDRAERGKLGRFYLVIGLHCAVGVALSAAYLVPFYFDFLHFNADRTASTYRWAAARTDTHAGLLSNLFVPVRASVSGAFGGSSLLLVGLLTPLLRLFRVRVPAVIWFVLGALFITGLGMMGRATPVHRFMWDYIPLFSSFRIPIRMSMYVPALLFIFMAWLMRERADPVDLPGGHRIPQPTLIALLALLLTALYLLLPDAITHVIRVDSPARIRDVPGWLVPALVSTGMLTFVVLAAHGLSRNWRSTSELVLCGLAMLQITMVLYFGTWVALREPTPELSQMLDYKRTTLDYRFERGSGMYSEALPPADLFRVIPREAFLSKIYRDPLVVEDRDEAIRLLLKMARGQMSPRLMLERYSGSSQERAGSMATGARSDRVDLSYSSFNRLVFDVEASQPGILTLFYPHTGHWRAEVDGKSATIYRANGYFHAIDVAAGRSEVEFRYESWAAVLGMALSCSILAVTGIWFAMGIRSRHARALVSIAIVVGCAAGFWSWRNSLYSGTNIETVFHWDPSLDRD